MQIEEKVCVLKALEKLAWWGIYRANEIIRICSGKMPTEIAKVKILAEKIEALDEQIGQIGFIHPESKEKLTIRADDSKMMRMIPTQWHGSQESTL